MSIREICTAETLDLDRVIAALNVTAIDVRKYVLSPGSRLDFTGSRHPSIFYLCDGHALFTTKNDQVSVLQPGSLVVAPTGSSFRFERTDRRLHEPWPGESLPLAQSTIVIGGTFNTCYGASTDLFDTLPVPIVETFDSSNGIGITMKKVLKEFSTESVGSHAMVAALMKQVLVCFIRNSLSSNNLWLQNFAVLSDPQVAKAFATMIASPGKPHTVISLAETACLSRSAFMSRFTHVIGRSPMVVLREIRMNCAAAQLLAGHYSLDQIMYNVGYTSRGSFVRAFRNVYSVDPSGYRHNIRLMHPPHSSTDHRCDPQPPSAGTLYSSIA